MYCPECRSEYRAEFTRCAACDVALVDELPIANAEELRNVFESADASRLTVVESVLRDAGIDFLVKNGALASMVPGASFSVGAVQVWVRAEDEAEARALLGSVDDST
jgi:Putative prokaryotic signal transducing protein